MKVNYIPYIYTPNLITVMFINVDAPMQITSSHPNFNKVKKKLLSNKLKSEEKLMELMRPVKMFESIIGDDTNGFNFVNGRFECVIEGYTFKLPSSISKEVLRVYQSKGNLLPMFNFVKRLAANPDREIVDDLFSFIQACGLAITHSGNFLAYKIVRSDFTDIYTGTMNNSPGSVVSMPRHAVEKDRNKTCSAGLHFAAWNYLDCYGRVEYDKVVILNIDPANVVSIPSDYDNQKGRAQSYKVLREVAMPEELKYYPVWSDEGVYDDDYDDEEDEDMEDYTSDEINNGYC